MAVGDNVLFECKRKMLRKSKKECKKFRRVAYNSHRKVSFSFAYFGLHSLFLTIFSSFELYTYMSFCSADNFCSFQLLHCRSKMLFCKTQASLALRKKVLLICSRPSKIMLKWLRPRKSIPKDARRKV